MQHLVSGCEKLAQKKYKRRHDNVVKKIHWDLCKKKGLEHTEKWYEHGPEGAVENEEVKVLWNIDVQCDNVMEARRPDIILIDRKEQKGIIIDISVPADVRVGGKKGENGKVPGPKERDWKIVKTQNGRSRACSDKSPWMCQKRI